LVLTWTPTPAFRFVAGFLPDNESLVTIAEGVQIGTAPPGDGRAKPRTPKCRGSRPQISPDGRYLGGMGYPSMYVYDLPALGTPRRISASSSFGDFRSLAVHPGGKLNDGIDGGGARVEEVGWTELDT